MLRDDVLVCGIDHTATVFRRRFTNFAVESPSGAHCLYC
jgi:hypothetical protein